MPNPWKKERFAAFISGIRSKRAGSLVVQTGFPTSLADLVVKNRARLKKPSKKKPCHSSDLDSIAASARSPSDGCRGSENLQLPLVENPDRIDEEITNTVLVSERIKVRGLGFGFRFLMVKLIVLVVLAIGKKRFVVGITILSFGLLLLEFFGFLKPRSNARESFNSGIEGFDLGGRELVSPIREVEIEGQDSLRSENDILSRSERNWEKSVVLDPKGDVLLERRVLAAVEKDCKDQMLGNSGNSKRKKLLRKLFRKKNRGAKDEKELIPCLVDRAIPDSNGKEEKEVPIEEQVDDDGNNNEDNDGEVLSFEASNEVSQFNTEDVDVIQESVGGTRLSSFRKLIFFIVVLLGLLGGKVVALVLTVAWYLLSGCTETVWRKWKMQ